MAVDAEYALVGGGLQNGLIALAIRARAPAARIVMIERDAAPGGNHTWCFHAGDAGPSAAWIEPLVVRRWPGYDVAFEAHARRLEAPYACITSARLAERVARALDVPGSQLLLHTTALHTGADRVAVRRADGAVRELRARVVIDARGPAAGRSEPCGWQKFVGHELVIAGGHGLERPLLLDATVEQIDGFRFAYVLPLDPVRVLVEDTYFSDGPELDREALRARIAAYAARRRWTVARVVREEAGVLPLPWQAAAPSTRPPLVAGYAGGWFHPVTGYSFPVAARLAEVIAAHEPGPALQRALDNHARGHARQLRFAARLSRMLFQAYAPASRHRVLAWFYRLPEEVIRRFYALELTGMDRARLLLRRPPRGLSLRGALGMEVS